MADIKTEMIQFPSNSHTMPGYLARPADSAKHPGIVVIQEWWGLVPHIKDVAERFAREGFIALAPDLYHGKASTEPDEARKLVMSLDRARAVGEIAAAARYLKQLKDVSPHKVGVIGFCMGGGLALSAAVHDGEIATAVAFYGRPLDPSDTAKLHVPILGLYGAKDHSNPPQAVQEFEEELEKDNVPHEIHTYPSAGHAFFNDTRPESYRPDAAKDAWNKTLAWFHKYLA
jgi:carboxymethylenebutenolidase